ncbi:MAG: hypothetical protein C4560_13920 [Nitrospiraceae bacterium]|nr:MAG: hypothetical protein C4560_13920 [Nitrospiraceae bacterium]
MTKRLVPLLLLFALTGCSTLPKNYIATDSRAVVNLEEMLGQIEDTRVVFTGELHGDRASHYVQLEVIKHLHKKGGKLVIAIEVFPSAMQDVLDRWVSGNIGKDDFAAIFQRNVNLPFSPYEEIFEFARTTDTPIIAIDVERSLVSDVSKNGIKTVPADFLQRIGFSACSENPEYAEVLGFFREREYHQSGMPYLCDAQRLRDAVMAFNIANILKSRGPAAVVVLTGIVHATKVAVPGLLLKHANVSYKVIIPHSIKYVIKRSPGPDVADYIWY